jgi:trehalose synthase
MGRAPSWQTPLVVQVSRWDSLKDPIGVLKGFASLVDGRMPGDAELVLAGPNVHAVADDPEAGAVFYDVLREWRALPHAVRDRVTLVSLPTSDVEENAAIVNALQTHAAVIVQKSLREGFGLTVTEGMWKGRAVVASRVGGICDQIEDGVSGLLVDPTDLDAFARALRCVLEDPALASRLGAAARERVRERFLGIRHLMEYADLLARLD